MLSLRILINKDLGKAFLRFLMTNYSSSKFSEGKRRNILIVLIYTHNLLFHKDNKKNFLNQSLTYLIDLKHNKMSKKFTIKNIIK